MHRKLIYFILFLIGFITLERICHKQTHGFRPHKIQSSCIKKGKWQSSIPSDNELEDLRNILSQPFFFLNSGGECYAFVSKDGKTVLKFFKLHHMRKEHWLDTILPLALKKSLQKKRANKLESLFTSCQLAYENFRNGTGLIYLHLSETDIFNIKIKLFDAIGAVHFLNLDTVGFALQQKATMAYPTITALVEAKEYDAAKQRLSSLVDLIVTRCQAGLEDHDARKRNFGFIGNQAIEIDLGSFTENQSLKTEEATKKILLLETLRLRRWVDKHHPDLSEFLEKTIRDHLSQKEPFHKLASGVEI